MTTFSCPRTCHLQNAVPTVSQTVLRVHLPSLKMGTWQFGHLLVLAVGGSSSTTSSCGPPDASPVVALPLPAPPASAPRPCSAISHTPPFSSAMFAASAATAAAVQSTPGACSALQDMQSDAWQPGQPMQRLGLRRRGTSSCAPSVAFAPLPPHKPHRKLLEPCRGSWTSGTGTTLGRRVAAATAADGTTPQWQPGHQTMRMWEARWIAEKRRYFTMNAAPMISCAGWSIDRPASVWHLGIKT